MSSDNATRIMVRTYIVLANGDRLQVTEAYEDVRDRVAAARGGAIAFGEDQMGNPLSLPLVNVRMGIRLSDDEDAVVDACFNPMHLVAMYRAHPDV